MIGLIFAAFAFILSYFSPGELFPSMAPYHLEWWFLGPALIASAVVVMGRNVSFRGPFHILMLLFWFWVGFSRFMVAINLGAAASALTDFGILAIAFYLVYINAGSTQRVAFLGVTLLGIALVLSVQGILAYHSPYQEHGRVMQHVSENLTVDKRLMALGFLNDPNDFGQFLVAVIPFFGFLYKRGRILLLPFILTALAILVYAIYLTESRGSMIGLVLLLILLIGRRANVVAKVVLGIMAFGGLLALNFGGGREISTTEGSAAGRVIAWGTGIAILEHSPVWGIGYQQFTKYNDLTAHNAFVLCFSELGLVGYFLWLGLLVATALCLERVIRQVPKSEAEEDIVRAARIIRLSLYVFLAQAWFLSRTYTLTLYILLGMALAVYQLALPMLERNPKPFKFHWLPVTAAVEVGSIIVVYITIRLRTL